jgi:hypothetical protein
MAKKKTQNIDLEQDRYGLFMTDNSFELDIMYGREYLKTDAPLKVKYYKIDVVNSKVDDLYGEAKPSDKKYFPAVELSVMVDVDDGETKYQSENGIARNDTGELKFGIFLDELKEKKIEIIRGDLVSYNFSGEKERFYEIHDADNINDVSSKSIGGFKTFYKLITATPVKEDVIPFIRNI